MTDNLKPENKALVERVLGYGTARTYNRHEIDRIIDAARTEGRESRASGEAPVAFYDPEHWRRVGPGREQCSTIYPAPAGTYRTPLYAAPREAWKPDREAVARLIHFMHGDGLSAEDAMRPTNDGHWDFWKDDPPHADAWKAADAILALPSAPPAATQPDASGGADANP